MSGRERIEKHRKVMRHSGQSWFRVTRISVGVLNGRIIYRWNVIAYTEPLALGKPRGSFVSWQGAMDRVAELAEKQAAHLREQVGDG